MTPSCWLVSSAIVFATASITSSASSVSTLSGVAVAGYSAKKSSGRAKTGIGFAPVCRVVALLHARRLQGAGVGARQNGKLHGVTICRELGHSHQIITSEHGDTDRRRKNRLLFARKALLQARPMTPRPVQHGAGSHRAHTLPRDPVSACLPADTFTSVHRFKGSIQMTPRPVQHGAGSHRAHTLPRDPVSACLPADTFTSVHRFKGYLNDPHDARLRPFNRHTLEPAAASRCEPTHPSPSAC